MKGYIRHRTVSGWVFDGESREVIDGPFGVTNELVAGFWMWEVKDMDEAVEWVKEESESDAEPERD